MTNWQWGPEQELQLREGLDQLCRKLFEGQGIPAEQPKETRTEPPDSWQALTGFLAAHRQELQEALGAYAQVLLQWHRAFHLLGEQSAEDFVALHLLDSLSGALFLAGAGLLQSPPCEIQLVDVGSGLGLPGLPLTQFLELWQSDGPPPQIFLVEPAARRASILRSMVAELGLQNRVEICQNPVAEWFKWQEPNALKPFGQSGLQQRIVTCRAFRPLSPALRKQKNVGKKEQKDWQHLLLPLKAFQGPSDKTGGVLLYKGNWHKAQQLEGAAQQCFFTLPHCDHQRSLLYFKI